MNEIKEYNNKLFEDIKHIDEEGNEYWDARELQKVLEYNLWQNFHKVIKEAMTACENSGIDKTVQFIEVNKLSINVNGGKRKIIDYHLTRYACYLIVERADSRKKIIALGQSYFAIQTRKQEILQKEIIEKLHKKDYSDLTEDEKRLLLRDETKDKNKVLYKTASKKGVKNFDKFTNAGYKGLYNGESANDIYKRKKLRYREDILDNMGSTELGINIFRITQTEELLNLQEEESEKKASDTHYNVGSEIRNTLKRLGTKMPEELPTPDKSTKLLEKEIKYKKIK